MIKQLILLVVIAVIYGALPTHCLAQLAGDDVSVIQSGTFCPKGRSNHRVSILNQGSHYVLFVLLRRTENGVNRMEFYDYLLAPQEKQSLSCPDTEVHQEWSLRWAQYMLGAANTSDLTLDDDPEVFEMGPCSFHAMLNKVSREFSCASTTAKNLDSVPYGFRGKVKTIADLRKGDVIHIQYAVYADTEHSPFAEVLAVDLVKRP